MENNLNDLVAKFNEKLGSALLSCDLWEKESLLSVASYNHNPKYATIIGNLVNELNRGIDSLGLPSFSSYQITDLEMNTILLVVNLGDKYVLGCLIDKSKVAYGTLLHITIPYVLDLYSKIVTEE